MIYSIQDIWLFLTGSNPRTYSSKPTGDCHIIVIFRKCEQYTIDSMLPFTENEVDRWYI